MAFLIKRICFFVILFCLAPARPAPAADEYSGRDLALELRNCVVRISAPSSGFGLIVGERDRQLFILTANHVISRDKQLFKTVTIQFNHTPKQDVVAKTVRLDERARKMDIGMLRVPKPGNFFWRKDTMAMARDHVTGLNVWYIGQSQEWKVAVEPGTIENEDIGDGQKIQLNMPVRGGSSGAPLISKYGVFGMLLAEGPASRYSRGVAIDAIQTACERNRIHWSLEPAPFSTQTMYRAKRDYDFGYYDAALRRFEPEAQKGNLTAMAFTGLIYFGEAKNTQDYEKAVSWTKRAASKGNGAGMLTLGLMHSMGFGGLAKNEATALYWIRESANRGFPEAVFHLGMVYQNGLLGQPRDRGKAIAYYRQACRLGYRSASKALQRMGQAPCD